MANKEPGKQPEWDLAVIVQSIDRKGQVGAGWNNPDGSISIRLNACVVLEANDDLTLRLFPRTPKS